MRSKNRTDEVLSNNDKPYYTYRDAGVVRLVAIVSFVVGFAIALTGVIFDEPAHAACADDPNVPCWHPQAAYDAGVTGRTDRIPDWVHDDIKAQVHSQGDDFEQKVKDNIPWYSKASWKLACLETAGARQMNKHLYFRCLDADQMDKFLGDLGHIYLKCGVGTLVITGFLVASDPGDGTLKAAAAIGGGAGCAAAESVDLLTWGWSQQDWHLANGPDSATVGDGGQSW